MAKAALTELINGLHRLYLRLWTQGFYTFNPSILNNTTSFIFGLSFPNQKWVLIFGLPEPNQKWRLLISFGLRSSFVSRYYKKQPKIRSSSYAVGTRCYRRRHLTWLKYTFRLIIERIWGLASSQAKSPRRDEKHKGAQLAPSGSGPRARTVGADHVGCLTWTTGSLGWTDGDAWERRRGIKSNV